MTEAELIKQLEQAQTEIAQLREQVERLQQGMSKTTLPDLMMLDRNFLKRAFAIYGHVFVAGLIISIPFSCLAFLLAFLTSGGF